MTVLPAAHRLREASDYRAVLRGRRDAQRLVAGRAGGDLLVVHLARRTGADAAAHEALDTSTTDARGASLPRVGFVVSKAVGNAVVRNRTKRILRHLAAARLAGLPTDTDVVVRAQPAAAGATTAQLADELDRLVQRASRNLR